MITTPMSSGMRPSVRRMMNFVIGGHRMSSMGWFPTFDQTFGPTPRQGSLVVGSGPDAPRSASGGVMHGRRLGCRAAVRGMH